MGSHKLVLHLMLSLVTCSYLPRFICGPLLCMLCGDVCEDYVVSIYLSMDLYIMYDEDPSYWMLLYISSPLLLVQRYEYHLTIITSL